MAASTRSRKATVSVPGNVRILTVPAPVLATLGKLSPQHGDRLFIAPDGTQHPKFTEGDYQIGESLYLGARCKCNERIDVGEWFISRRGEGALHMSCLAKLPAALAEERATRAPRTPAPTRQPSGNREYRSANGKKVFDSKADRDAYDAKCRAAGERMAAGRARAAGEPVAPSMPTRQPDLTVPAGDDIYSQLAGITGPAPVADTSAKWDFYTPYTPTVQSPSDDECPRRAGRPRVRHIIFNGTLDNRGNRKMIGDQLQQFAGQHVEVMLRLITAEVA